MPWMQITSSTTTISDMQRAIGFSSCVAHALLRAVLAIVPTPVRKYPNRSHECERRTPSACATGIRIALALLIGLSVHAIDAQDWAKARLEKSPRHRERVMVKNGGRTIPTLVVYPEAKDKKPVVLLIHDSAGVTDWFEDFADQVAAMGYVVLAPNLLPSEKQVMEDLNAVADYGVKLPASDGRLFAAGIGWGGAQGFRFAADRPDLAAVLVICGASPDKDAVARVKGTIFGFYAANDERVNATVPPAQAAAKAAGVVFEAVTYDGVGPQFMQSGDAPDAKASDRLARGYALERMKSVLDMVTLRGY
jgi:carboxymethylenebutenolidase